MAAEEYALRVPLKPGGREYLRMLRRAGVKLAVTTSMPDSFCRMRSTSALRPPLPLP